MCCSLATRYVFKTRTSAAFGDFLYSSRDMMAAFYKCCEKTLYAAEKYLRCEATCCEKSVTLWGTGCTVKKTFCEKMVLLWEIFTKFWVNFCRFRCEKTFIQLRFCCEKNICWEKTFVPLENSEKNGFAVRKYFHYEKTFPFPFPYVLRCQCWDVTFLSSLWSVSYLLANAETPHYGLGIIMQALWSSDSKLLERRPLWKTLKLLSWLTASHGGGLRSTFALTEYTNSIWVVH